MSVKVGINGFGRIGRLVYRASLEHPGVEVVAINDLVDAETNAYLLKYDSTHGQLPVNIKPLDSSIMVNGHQVRVFSEREPKNLPWGDLGVEIVVESTGFFTDATKAAGHLEGGARKVIISAPAKNEDITIVLGVNEDKYDPARHRVISNASCTTNCLAPMTRVIHEHFGVRRGLMTTVHSYTNDQRILDQAHKDLRRARSAGMSIIPTTTGAARAIGLVLPELKGKLNGLALRVPTANVSITDLVAEVSRPVTVEEVNNSLKEAAAGPLNKYLAFCDEPLVSRDFNGNPHSCIIDGLSTMVLEKTMVKVVGWYDNEWGYSNRCVELAAYLADRGL